MAISGECFCGAVMYRLDGELHDARSCHCARCRKAFSAQASAYALVDAARFHWVSGEELLTSYVGEHGIHSVTLGCVNGDPDIEIGAHIHVGSKARWEVIPEGVRVYQAGELSDEDHA